MPSYPPPAGTYVEQPPPVSRPATNRARTNSATAEKYRPRTYSHPPPNQPDPTLLGPAQQPYGAPAPTSHPQPIHTPYPQRVIYTTAPAPLPMPQPAPIYPPPPQEQQPVAAPGFPSPRHSSYAHPPRPPLPIDDYHSRPSYSSQRSHHSSRHSKHSRHSTDDERKHDGRHHGDRAKRDLRADIDRRPTMGDSVIAFFGLIKSALGPRDK